MRILLIIVALLVSIETNIQAKEKANKEQPKANGEVAESKDSAGENIPIIGGGAKIGYVMYPIIGSGFSIFYPGFKKMQIGFEYLGGELIETETNDSGIKKYLKIYNQTYVIDFRFFLGDSFNLTAGLGQRILGYEIRAESPDTDFKLTITGEAKSIVIKLALGNIWRFDSGLYLGFDWLGFMIPISNTNSSSTKSNQENLTEEDKEHKENTEEIGEDLSDKFGTATSGQLLLVNIGWIF